MGRYEPLRNFLDDMIGDHAEVTFAQLEAVLGVSLPASKRYPAWWSNNPSNNPMTKVWLAAGFQTEQVDVNGERLVFRRAHITTDQPSGVEEASVPFLGAGLLERLRANLGGTVRFAPGFDPTAPTGEVWEAER